MKILLQLEEAAMLAISIYFVTYLPFSGWWYAAFFLAPDLGMIGYIINTTVGAFTYNLLHHKGIAILVLGSGVYFHNDYVSFAGLIMIGHSSFDRILGYGLKHTDSFQHTHLGWIGKGVKN